MTHRVAIQALLISAAVASNAAATAITDISQIPGSAFGAYGLIVEGGAHNLQLTSNSPVNGNVALKSPISLQGGGDTITGNLDFSGASNGTGSVTVTGTTSINSAQAGNAVADALSLFSAYTALTSLPALTANTLNVSTNAGSAYNGNSHEHVYSASTSFSGALAITAAATEYVIINVGHGSSANYSLGAVSLTGGITSDHVLFNIETSGQLSSANAHGLIVNAIIIDDGGKVNVDNFTLNGRLFCTTTANDCQVVSGAAINATVSTSATPEPVSMVLAGSGMLFLLGLRRFKIGSKQA